MQTQPNEQELSDELILQKFYAKGGSLRMLTDVAEEDLASLYAYAGHLFSQGALPEAKRLYLLLTQLDQWNFDYWLALGVCCQRLSEHEEALACFAESAKIRMTDPRSAYFAGVNYQLLGNIAYAKKAYTAALAWCSDHPEYQTLKDTVSQALASCSVERKAP